jgi:hypothetical protein
VSNPIEVAPGSLQSSTVNLEVSLLGSSQSDAASMAKLTVEDYQKLVGHWIRPTPEEST